MPERRDLFGECNVDAHPIDTFIRDCCANCINPECTRSLAGKAKFEDRALNWFERYFGEKDRMDPRDPRFSQIAGQKFIFIDPGVVGLAPTVGSAWVDPRDIGSPQEPPQAPSPPAPAPEPLRAAVASPPPAPEPPQAAPEAPKPAPAAPPPGARGIPHRLLLANVPVQPGAMIPRPPSAPSANPGPTGPKDPWAGPVADPKDDAPIVSPGARVKMGGGGV